VLRDETQVGQTQATTYTDTLGGKSPTATYVVVAYDAAGNVSAPSSAVSVPQPPAHETRGPRLGAPSLEALFATRP
jgi:hypothetical protein